MTQSSRCYIVAKKSSSPSSRFRRQHLNHDKPPITKGPLASRHFIATSICRLQRNGQHFCSWWPAAPGELSPVGDIASKLPPGCRRRKSPVIPSRKATLAPMDEGGRYGTVR